MAKLIKFQKATVKGPIEGEGYIVHLRLGDRTNKFVMQMDGSRPQVLTDYRTGMRLASLGGLALARYVSNPYAYRGDNLPTFRALAQEWLDAMAAEKGPEHIRTVLAGPATLNT